MPEYINNNPFTVFLTGPDGTEIRLKSRQTKILSEYYERFVVRGFISRVNEESTKTVQIRKNTTSQVPIARHINQNKPTLDIRKPRETHRKEVKTKIITNKSQTVGQVVRTDGDRIYNESGPYSISNNIGIGILSYNRLSSLKTLVESIKKYTDLSSTTIIISDDCSTDQDLLNYLETVKAERIITLKNKTRLGIAGNTNRLIQCLSRFKYGILLNDDVIVKDFGWEYFYVRAMEKTGYNHFIHRQPGIYGAEKGTPIEVNATILYKSEDKPQGAILAYKTSIVDTIGYFDESFGIYGMEHVDWSSKVFEHGLQPSGFYDVKGSDSYFSLPKTASSVENRVELLRNAKAKFEHRTKLPVALTAQSRIDPVSYIIPCRNFERTDSIETVILSIKAQKYPHIEIVVSEQDVISRLTKKAAPYKHILTSTEKSHLFNKALAFNQGVKASTGQILALHDADIIANDFYTIDLVYALQSNNACHLGKTVIYTNQSSAAMINNIGIVGGYPKIERVVGYFEGGSLACTKEYYWDIGGFNEDFWGYGVEDCEFYARLKYKKFVEDRKHVFLHLHHSRFPGWEEHHEANKKLGENIAKLPIEEKIKRQKSQLTKLGYT